MIKNQWYAVLDAKGLRKGKMLGVKRLGMTLLFCRYQDGTVSCFAGGAAESGEIIRGLHPLPVPWDRI